MNKNGFGIKCPSTVDVPTNQTTNQPTNQPNQLTNHVTGWSKTWYTESYMNLKKI